MQKTAVIIVQLTATFSFTKATTLHPPRCSNIIWVPSRINPPVTRSFCQQLVQGSSNGTIKAPHNWFFVRECHGWTHPLHKLMWKNVSLLWLFMIHRPAVDDHFNMSCFITSNYCLSKCWPNPMPRYGINMTQWFKCNWWWKISFVLNNGWYQNTIIRYPYYEWPQKITLLSNPCMYHWTDIPDAIMSMSLAVTQHLQTLG